MILINTMNGYQQIGLGTYNLYDELCTEIVKNAINIGYSLIDTAQLYKNHTFIKDGINLSNKTRDDIFITSKVHNRNIIKKRIPESIDLIKKELETDYIDLILLHNPTKNYIEGWQELIRCQNHFNIKYIGTSNFNVSNIEEIEKITGIIPSLNQIEYNIFNQQNELVNYLNEKNILIQSHTGLTRKTKIYDQQLNNLSIKYTMSPIFMMNKFILQNNIGIIPKTTNIDHLKENFNILNKQNLNNEIMEELKKFDEQFSLFKKYD